MLRRIGTRWIIAGLFAAITIPAIVEARGLHNAKKTTASAAVHATSKSSGRHTAMLASKPVSKSAKPTKAIVHKHKALTTKKVTKHKQLATHSKAAKKTIAKGH